MAAECLAQVARYNAAGVGAVCNVVDEPEVRTTALGDHAGLYGALATYRARCDSLVVA